MRHDIINIYIQLDYIYQLLFYNLNKLLVWRRLINLRDKIQIYFGSKFSYKGPIMLNQTYIILLFNSASLVVYFFRE